MWVCAWVEARPSSWAWIWWWYNFNPKRPRVEVVFPFHIKSSHSNTSSSPIATCSAFVSLSLLYTSHTGHVCVLVSLGFLFPSVETLNAFWHICQYVCKIFTLLPEAIDLNKNAMTLSWFGFYYQRTNFRAENINLANYYVQLFKNEMYRENGASRWKFSKCTQPTQAEFFIWTWYI